MNVDKNNISLENIQTPSSRCIQTRQSRDNKSRSSTNCESSNYIRGDRISQSAVHSISALYRPMYEKYPTFPSIYQTKYQHDFKFIPFPVSSNYKPTSIQSKYTGFKFGSSLYDQHFQVEERLQPKRKLLPVSRDRHHNPQPTIKITQNYPNQVRFIWSKLEGKQDRLHTAGGVLSNKEPILQHHRWNSR